MLLKIASDIEKEVSRRVKNTPITEGDIFKERQIRGAVTSGVSGAALGGALSRLMLPPGMNNVATRSAITAAAGGASAIAGKRAATMNPGDNIFGLGTNRIIEKEKKLLEDGELSDSAVSRAFASNGKKRLLETGAGAAIGGGVGAGLATLGPKIIEKRFPPSFDADISLNKKQKMLLTGATSAAAALGTLSGSFPDIGSQKLKEYRIRKEVRDEMRNGQ